MAGKYWRLSYQNENRLTYCMYISILAELIDRVNKIKYSQAIRQEIKKEGKTSVEFN